MAPAVTHQGHGQEQGQSQVRMPGGRTRQRHWPVLLVLLLLVVPSVEVVVIVAVGRAIGGWPTFALLMVESAFGAWLVRREGSRSWRALQEALTSGRMPSRQLADAALVLVGGVLLLAPGFITDILGFFLVLPFTRPMARGLLEAAVARRLLAGSVGRWSGGPAGPGGGAATGGEGDVIEGEVL